MTHTPPRCLRRFSRTVPCALVVLLAATACDPDGEAGDAELDDEEGEAVIGGDVHGDSQQRGPAPVATHEPSSAAADAIAARPDAPHTEGTDGKDRSNAPAEALEVMAELDAAKVAPQFFPCPYYLSYEVIGFTELGLGTPEWAGPAAALFTANQPSWSPGGGGVVLVCGTDESDEPFMSARRFVSGVTTCFTSAPGQANAWFVCS